MVLREGDQAREQARVLDEGALQRSGAAQRQVVAAAAARLAPVEQVLLGVEAGVQRGVEDPLDQRGVGGEGIGGREVHLKDAGIGREREAQELGRRRRRIALEPHLGADLRRARSTAAIERQRLRGRSEGRKEDLQRALARLDGQRGVHGGSGGGGSRKGCPGAGGTGSSGVGSVAGSDGLSTSALARASARASSSEAEGLALPADAADLARSASRRSRSASLRRAASSSGEGGARGSGSGSAGSSGSTGGEVPDSELSGKRRPIWASPGSRKRCPRRRLQRSETNLPSRKASGST